MKTIKFTQEGYQALQKEKTDLLELRKEAVNLLQKAREMGDLSENAAYKVARAKLSSTDSLLRHINRLLEYGRVVHPFAGGMVGIGSTVTLNDDREDFTLQIVGSYETKPSEGKISHLSPLGSILINKTVGESVTLNLPSGKTTYKILKIV